MDNHQTRDDDYFRTAKIHYIIDGKKYHVPMGYQWWMHIKYNQWPTPKAEYTETTSFQAFALLPDFRPYSNETAAQFDNKRGHGDVVSIMVTSQAGRGAKPLKELIEIWKESGSFEPLPPNPEAPDLDHYLRKRGKNSPEESWVDVYLPAHPGDGQFYIQCVLGVPSPGCSLFDYANFTGLTKKSGFALRYLNRWRDIRGRTEALISSFCIE